MAEEGRAVGRISRVEDMPVFQLLYELALRVEKCTRAFGHDFRWLRNQALRSSESACANLTEGFYSQYSTEYLQSLFRCRREARETTTHLRYSEDVGALDGGIASSLRSEYEQGMKQLSAVIASVERKIQVSGKGRPAFSCVKESAFEYLPGDQDSGIPSEPLTINH